MPRRRRRRRRTTHATKRSHLTPAKKKAVRKHISAIKRLLKVR